MTVNSRTELALSIGRLTLVSLYLESAIGKFGALDGIAGALAGKGIPQRCSSQAWRRRASALGVAVGFLTQLAASGLFVFTVLATPGGRLRPDWS